MTKQEPFSPRTAATQSRLRGAEVTQSVCPYCAIGCGLLVFTRCWRSWCSSASQSRAPPLAPPSRTPGHSRFRCTVPCVMGQTAKATRSSARARGSLICMLRPCSNNLMRPWPSSLLMGKARCPRSRTASTVSKSMPWWGMSAPWRSSTSPAWQDFGEAWIGSAARRCPGSPCSHGEPGSSGLNALARCQTATRLRQSRPSA